VRIQEIKPNEGAVKSKKRLGRGQGSGLGKMSGRGGKGQTARKSGGIPAGFEGGQMPLYLRVMKRGFKNPAREEVLPLNFWVIKEKIVDGVFDGALASKGVVVKLLSDGDVPSHLKVVRNVRLSKVAREKLIAGGVTIEE